MTGGGDYFGRPQEQSRGVPESAQPPGGVKPVSRKAQVRGKHHPSSAQIDRILSLNQSGMHILLLNILELAVGRAHTHQLEIFASLGSASCKRSGCSYSDTTGLRFRMSWKTTKQSWHAELARHVQAGADR